jgi:hypothetical protein
VARPSKTKEPVIKEKSSLIEEARELSRIADKDNDGLKAKELVFCRLIAEGGFSNKDAYIQAFDPEDTVTSRSIIEMSSRLASKPSAAHEIERIRTDIREESMQKQTKLMFALDSRKVNERILIELYSLATSASVDSKTKLRAIETLGKCRSIDAFVSSTSINTSNVINGALGINTNGTASEARNSLSDSVKKLLESRKSEVIDV